MRTTLDLAPDVLQEARSLARFEGVSVGEAVNRLVRRSRNAPAAIGEEDGFPIFSVPSGGQAITLEQTLELEDEL